MLSEVGFVAWRANTTDLSRPFGVLCYIPDECLSLAWS